MPAIRRAGRPKATVNQISKRYGELWVLRDFSTEVGEGEFLAIVGPSGCGKSSLLRILAGLEKPTSGEVVIDGKKVTAPDPKRNLVFQEHALYPWRTVFQNVALGLEIRRMKKAEIRARVLPLIQAVGLGGFEDYYPHQLSGGMRQRASLARAFAVDPDLLLLDEPFGALDAITRLALQDELLRLWKDSGKTVILITHDVEEALYLADRVLVMSPRPGRVDRVIPVTEERPRDRGGASLAALKGEVLERFGLQHRSY